MMAKCNYFKEAINQKIDRTVQYVKTLPDDLIYWQSTDEELSVMMVLLEVQKYPEYWLDEILKVVRGASTGWGKDFELFQQRLKTDQMQCRRVRLSRQIQQIKKTKKIVTNRLSYMNDFDLQVVAPSPHSRSYSAKTILEKFVIDHLDCCYEKIKWNATLFTKQHADPSNGGVGRSEQ